MVFMAQLEIAALKQAIISLPLPFFCLPHCCAMKCLPSPSLPLSLLTSSSSSSTSSSLSPAPLPLLHLPWPHTPSPSPSPSLSLCALQSCGSHSEKSFAVVGFFIRPGVLRLVFLRGCFLQRLCKKNKNNFKKKVCSQQRREICTQRSLRKKKGKNTERVGNFSCFILAGERLLLSPL